MASRTWVLRIIVTADEESPAAELDMAETLGGTIGTEPLSRLADYVDRFSPMEIALTTTMLSVSDDPT